MRGRDLVWLAGRFTICRFPPDTPTPQLPVDGFLSVSRSPEELSLVCAEGYAPIDALSEGPFAALRVAGAMELGLVGVLASLAGPLAEAGIAIFAVSTFDTDYLLVKEDDRDRAEATLVAAGHRFRNA
jgi:hypothetical protein